MKTDEILQQDVRNALQWEPLLTTCNIKVSSNDGVVTLTGSVDNYTKKTEAENTSMKVAGVKSVINKIDITLNSWDEKKDIEITAEILDAFRWNWNTLNDTIKVKVINGNVTLSGEVEWNYQKEAATLAVTNLIGIKGVSNNITLKSQNDNIINKTTLKLALQNHLALDSIGIEIEISDSNITLKGTVDSWYQKELAGRIAWKALGVINVDNELVIEEEE
jgi:osmotically-inducible protein OsmY